MNLEISTKVLNKKQAVINKFMWDNKKAKIKRMVVGEKKVKSGGGHSKY